MKTLPGLLLLTGLLLSFQTTPGLAAEIKLEIFYLPHRPAMAVVNKLEQVAAEFSDVVVHKYNLDDPGTGEMVEKYQITEHLPVAVFINGRDSFTVEGRVLKLRNFPKGDAFVPMFAGEWDYSDLRAILVGLAGRK
jgi:hypothetical protein